MKKLLTFIFLLFTTVVFSQKEASIWYFGQHAGLKFNDNATITPLTDGKISNYEGCSSISDANGNLLFYTDGIKVWNQQHSVMSNGSGLLGDISSTQSAVVVPKPNSTSIYYVFTTPAYAKGGVYYSEIDMTLNNGLGDVTSNKNIPLVSLACEKLTAIKNDSDGSCWVLTHGYGNNSFFAYNVSNTGVNTTAVISNVGDNCPAQGYLKFSPDGKKVVNCGFNDQTLKDTYEKKTVLFDFDLATGTVSNPIQLSSTSDLMCYGAEFSPSGNVLYLTDSLTLYQLDLTAADIPKSKTILYQTALPTYDNPLIMGLQLGPDGKIYGTVVLENYLCVVNNPDIMGVNCNFVLNGVPLSKGVGIWGLPQFIQSYFEYSINAQDNCMGSAIPFSLNVNQSVTGITWDFGDGSPTSNAINPTHQYVAVGKYLVTVTATSSTGKTINQSKTITISNAPIANTVSNQSVCGTDNMQYDLSQFNSTLLGNQSTATYGVFYFLSLADANNQQNVLPFKYNLPLGSTTFYAKVYNLTNPGCFTTTSFTVNSFSTPVANTPDAVSVCDDASNDGKAVFNLQNETATVLGNQDSNQYTVNYHFSQFDANANNNPLALNYQNSSNPQTIYIRVTNKQNTDCFAITSFQIKVNKMPIINNVNDQSVCWANNMQYDLSQFNSTLLGNQSATTYGISYFSSLADANNQQNVLSINYNLPLGKTTFYAKVYNLTSPDCFATTSFTVNSFATPVANTPDAVSVCDDVSNDGKAFFNLQNETATVLGNQDTNLYTVSYHFSQNDADANSNPLALNYQNSSDPQTIYVRVTNKQNTNCFVTTSFQIRVNKMPIAFQPKDLYLCDDDSNDGTEKFDLTKQTPDVLGNQSASDFNITYYLSQNDADSKQNAIVGIIAYSNISNPQIVYARIENQQSSSCFETTSFQLIVKSKPVLIMNDVYSICQGKSIEVIAPTEYSSYNWSDGTTENITTITKAGNYSLIVTKDYGEIACTVTKNIVVNNSNAATITKIDTQDWTDNNNTISVYATGDGIYQYSIDGINYQDSPVFSDLPSGSYTVYVNDKNGCGTVTTETYLLVYPKFFTPNGDGYNDTWKIKFSFFEPELKVAIFDRYGKFLKQLDHLDDSWNGKHNELDVPSDDYWFLVTRANGKEYKGHFSLVR